MNIRRAGELLAQGRMHESGKKAYAARNDNVTVHYSFEERPSKLDAASDRTFRANRKAWEYFQTQAPWYCRTSIFWVMEAKREETRARRLAELIACSARGEPIRLLDRRPKQR